MNDGLNLHYTAGIGAWLVGILTAIAVVIWIGWIILLGLAIIFAIAIIDAVREHRRVKRQRVG